MLLGRALTLTLSLGERGHQAALPCSGNGTEAVTVGGPMQMESGASGSAGDAPAPVDGRGRRTRGLVTVMLLGRALTLTLSLGERGQRPRRLTERGRGAQPPTKSEA